MVTQYYTRSFIVFRLIVYCLVPFILIVLPVTYFDNGKTICLSVLVFNQECYGCGMTRAMMRIIHLDFTDAIYFNPLSIVAFPVLAYCWARLFLDDWKLYRKQ